MGSAGLPVVLMRWTRRLARAPYMDNTGLVTTPPQTPAWPVLGAPRNRHKGRKVPAGAEPPNQPSDGTAVVSHRVGSGRSPAHNSRPKSRYFHLNKRSKHGRHIETVPENKLQTILLPKPIKTIFHKRKPKAKFRREAPLDNT